MDTELYIRPMQPEDLDRAMALKNEEGWNQTKKDWLVFLNRYPQFCLVAVAAENPVGTITAIVYQNRLAWIGMMLVDRNYRRRGISRRLMRELLHRLSGVATIKLDATPEGQLVYESMGFVKEYTLWRYVRNPGHFARSAEKLEGVSPLDWEELPKLTEFDAAVFGVEREELLRYLVNEFPKGAFVRKTGRQINGFLMCRQGTRYMQVGPLVAESDEAARSLVGAALQGFSDQALVLDVAADKKEFRDWLEAAGFEKRRPLTRMYYRRSGWVGIPGKYYLIAGPEMG